MLSMCLYFYSEINKSSEEHKKLWTFDENCNIFVQETRLDVHRSVFRPAAHRFIGFSACPSK